MDRIGSIDLGTNTTQFHGLPAIESKTVSLWKVEVKQPVDTNNVPYSTDVAMYYSPFIKSTNNGVVESDYMYLLSNGETTNALGQVSGQFFNENDFSLIYNAAATNSHEGIPNSWWELYFGPTWATNHAGADNDGDTYDNFNEYITDTDPTNLTSFYVRTLTNAALATGTTLDLLAGPPTSAARLYDIWWNTDLDGEQS